MNNLKLITTHKDYQQIIPTQPKYLLLIDTEASLDGLDRKPVVTYHKVTEAPHIDYLYEEDLQYYAFPPHRIIAHLPLNNTPVLEGVPLLPELPKQDDKELEDALFCIDRFCPHLSPRQREVIKAASQRRWTDEDVRKAWDKFGDENLRPPSTKSELLTSLQSLSPVKLPIGFNCYWERRGDGEGKVWFIPIIRDNVIQGRYIYE